MAGHDGYSQNGRGRSSETWQDQLAALNLATTLRENHQYWHRPRIRFLG